LGTGSGGGAPSEGSGGGVGIKVEEQRTKKKIRRGGRTINADKRHDQNRREFGSNSVSVFNRVFVCVYRAAISSL
jgi:hypothetical protein